VPDFKCEMARLYGMGLWYRWHCPKWVRNTILNRIRVETDVAANNVGVGNAAEYTGCDKGAKLHPARLGH